MIWRILKFLIAGVLILALLFWLWSGGFSSVVRFVKTIPNPIDIIWGNATSTYQIHFPWQQLIPQGPDISGLTDAGNAMLGESSADQTDYSQSQPRNTSTTGTPSPYAGRVSLSSGTATESDVRHEYLELSSRSNSPITLTGWSIQSVLTGVRVYIPPAAAPFLLGSVNTALPVVLGPGEGAIVVSGPSPVGVSFRENTCTGYLSQLQSFDPSLQNACPASSEMAPLTADNLHQYGSDCMDFAQSLPECRFPTTLPASITPGCRAFITNTFTYGNCVAKEGAKSSFELETWRLYFNARTELWANGHDIIRLLDGNGNTVDSLTY